MVNEMRIKTITLLVIFSMIAGLGTASASVVSEYEILKTVCEDNLKTLSDIPVTAETSSQLEKQISITKAELEELRTLVKFNERELKDLDLPEVYNWISSGLAECDVKANRLETLNTFGTSDYNTVDEINLYLLPARIVNGIGSYTDMEMVTLVTGSSPPYKYSLGSFMSGTPPPGMTIDILNGNLIGTPTTAGTYEFEVCVSDLGGRTSCKQTSVVIEEEKDTANSSPIMSIINYFLNLIGFSVEFGGEDDDFFEDIESPDIPDMGDIPDIDIGDIDNFKDGYKDPSDGSIYDGTYKGTFNYEYANFVRGEEIIWIPGSFDLEMTLKTYMILPEMTVNDMRVGGIVNLDVINVWCSDPGFGTGSTGVVPLELNDLRSVASLPLYPTKPLSEMNIFGIFFTLPNGASLAAPSIGGGMMQVSSDGRVLSSDPQAESNVWDVHSVVSGPLSDAESVTTRQLATFDGDRIYKFTSWTLTKTD